MVISVELIAEESPGANLVQDLLENRLYAVTRCLPSRASAATDGQADCRIFYGGGDTPAVLSAALTLGRDAPSMLITADPSFRGSAALSLANIDECLVLPLDETCLDVSIQRQLDHWAKLQELRERWPKGLPLPTAEVGTEQHLTLVEPDRLTRARCADLLVEQGYVVCQETWASLPTAAPTSLLIANPGIGGQVPENLRRAKEFGDQSDQGFDMIVLRGQGAGPLGHERAAEAGAFDVLEKPFADAFLLTQVRAVFRRQGEWRALNDGLADLRRMGAEDALSGLRSRAFAERALVYGPQVSLAMLDMDNLKQINDRLGHLAGDEAIRQIGRVLKTQFHEPNLIARWGGDEFLVFNAKGEDLVTGLEASLKRLSAIKLDAADRRDMSPDFSYGLAHGGEGASMDALIRLADARLYENKRTKKGGQNPL